MSPCIDPQVEVWSSRRGAACVPGFDMNERRKRLTSASLSKDHADEWYILILKGEIGEHDLKPPALLVAEKKAMTVMILPSQHWRQVWCRYPSPTTLWGNLTCAGNEKKGKAWHLS